MIKTVLLLACVFGTSFCWLPVGLQGIAERGFSGNLQNMIENYPYELLALLGVAMYIANYLIGLKTNRHLAELWVKHNYELFTTQFAAVGINKMNAAEPFEKLDQQSNSHFTFYASGRVNTKYCMVSISTKKRQDLISMIFLNLIWPERDRITFNIPLEATSKSGTPVCFTVIRKRLVKSLFEQFDDLKILCKRFKVDGITDKVKVYSDHPEFLKIVMTQSTKEFLKKFDKNFEFLYITDRMTFIRTNLALRATFVLPKASEMEKSKEISLFILKLIEKVVGYRVTNAKLLAKLSKSRGLYESKREDNEEKRREKEEKTKREKEEKWAKMTPKERKRLKDIEEKRMKSRMQKKMKIK